LPAEYAGGHDPGGPDGTTPRGMTQKVSGHPIRIID
jgi:hypothetical protein